jgi:ABC-type antimicrobial peptide transport system permease subunit
MALGARVSQIGALVVSESLRLTILGLVIGLVAAVLGTRLLRSLLFGVSATDPLVLVAAPLLLLVIAVLASAGPARRAARVDPVDALRSE